MLRAPQFRQLCWPRPKELVALMKETVVGWNDDKVPRLDAALAFYTLLSLAPPTSTMVQGVLIDKACSARAETRMVTGVNAHMEGGMLWAYTHDRKCLLMPACQRSGYGVFTFESTKFLPFDPAGNQKALVLIQAGKKQDDMRVEVIGQIDGDKIKVTSLKLLP
jgi:hypothetical protein